MDRASNISITAYGNLIVVQALYRMKWVGCLFINFGGVFESTIVKFGIFVAFYHENLQKDWDLGWLCENVYF